MITGWLRKSVINQNGRLRFRKAAFQFFNNLFGSWLAAADAPVQPQIDQDIDQGVQIGNRFSIADVRTFNPKRFGLAVDALRSGALLVDIFIELAVTRSRV
jgi:hypothetical protein